LKYYVLKNEEVTRMQSDARVSFFVQLEKGKRSFMLRIGDVNEKKVSLMAAMDKFHLVDTTAGVSGEGKKPIVTKSDGSMSVPLIAGHTYQVFKGILIYRTSREH
jgi:hypothetical protein